MSEFIIKAWLLGSIVGATIWILASYDFYKNEGEFDFCTFFEGLIFSFLFSWYALIGCMFDKEKE